VNAYGLQLEEIIKIVPGIEHRFVLEKKGNALHVDFAFKDTLNKANFQPPELKHGYS
jgi:hypothetical protein